MFITSQWRMRLLGGSRFRSQLRFFRSWLRTQHVASAEHARHSNAAISKKLLARERCIHERDFTSRPSDILLEYCYFLRSPFRDVFATPAATFRSACETTR